MLRDLNKSVVPMVALFRKYAIILLIVSAGMMACKSKASQQKDAAKTAAATNLAGYTCTPCGYDCDSASYGHAGSCSKCNMPLVEKSTAHINHLEPLQLCALLNGKDSGEVLLLDVRTLEEFNGTAKDKFGRLKNAINIPVQQLQPRLAELNAYKHKPIIVYCSHNHRSPAAAYLLQQAGFSNVKNMRYGMSEWKQKVTSSNCNQQLFVAQ